MHISRRAALSLAPLAALGLAAAPGAQAQTLAPVAEASLVLVPGQYTYTSDKSGTAQTLLIGGYNTSYQGSAEIVYQLPTLLPGQTFTFARFHVYAVNTNTYGPQVYDIDLSGLAARTSAVVQNGDYYAGSPANAPAGTTTIQTKFIPSAYHFGNGDPANGANTPTGVYTTSLAGETALTDYLNAQAAALPGGFIFLRLNPSVDPNADASGFNTNVQDTVGAIFNTDVTRRPVLTYTVSPAAAPEPSSFAALGLGLLLLSGRTLKARRLRA